MPFESIPGVCEVEFVPGAGAAGSAPPDVLIEIAHGATREAHFDALRARLSPGLPDDLKDFFFVNTDAGSPEYARAVAGELARGEGGRALSVLIVRSLLPRTFLDCNRLVDAAGPEMTAAFPGYIREPSDRRILLSIYEPYQELVTRAFELVCDNGGLGLMLHTYAPRSVEIESIDEGIGAALRDAYRPENYDRWQRRPDADVISRTPDGELLAPEPLVGSLVRRFEQAGIRATQNVSYRLHPATTACGHARAWPGRTLCLEVNRALLCEEFTPFQELHIEPARVIRVSAPIAGACAEFLAR